MVEWINSTKDMVDNTLLQKELLINSEAFFISKINSSFLKQCLDIENSALKTRSNRSINQIDEFLNNYTCFGLFNKNKTLLGFAFFSIVLDEAELLDITINNDNRKLGLGFAFLTETFKILKSNHTSTVILEVAIDNLAAIKTYQKFKFTQIGIRKNYYQNNNNTTTDALVYQIHI
jgi:[ribosomal protein S18]-alanine N-acetyltransferase